MAGQLPASSGASNTLFQHERPNNVNRSRFDLSRITNFTADAGMIIPFDVIPTLPGDDFDINFKMVMDTLPLVSSSLTSYKVTTHWYYVKNRDCWKGWNTFITKGRSGNISLTIPRIDLEHPAKVIGGEWDIWKDNGYQAEALMRSSHSLSSFLGVPSDLNGVPQFVYDYPDTNEVLIKEQFLPFTPHFTDTRFGSEVRNKWNNASKTGFNLYRYPSAISFMGYQNIVKWNYVNQNMLQDCEALFPRYGDDDWMIPADATITNYVGFKDNASVGDLDNALATGVYKSDDKVVRLDCLRYAQFDDDYFTTGLPWLQRGDVQSLTFSGDLSDIFESPLGTIQASAPLTDYVYFLNPQNANASLLSSDGATNRYTDKKVVGALNNMLKDKIELSSSFTANQLREMLALSVWQERNARVNGSYNMMIYQHWRQNPHSEEHKPVYIGGTVDNVSFTNVLQNSSSVDGQPLGSTAGRASAGGSSYVGKFHADDYGMIFGIMIIKPNTTYMQGVEHFLSCENVFEDFVQPEFESLSPQPILNKELYVSANSNDDKLLAYQERYTYLKVRQNVNRGLFQIKPGKDSLFSPMTQARWFGSLPKLSYQFLCMSPDNMRRDFLAYPMLPAFRLQTASEVFVTRALSYTSQPNTFGF